MKISAVIPARYSSTRFPGKVLADICGKPMIQHVYERTKTASLIDDVVVATDDERIFSVVLSFGGKAIMTSPDHESGTDRLAEAAGMLSSDIIVNVQGDEPLIDPESIDAAVKPFAGDPSILMSTLKTRIRSLDDVFSPGVVKVVTDIQENALYFSRSPIPFYREIWSRITQSDLDSGNISIFKHIGLYVYRTAFLETYSKLPQSSLEKAEKLEQLRVLENGFKIRVVETDFDSIGVDEPSDLEAVLKIIGSQFIQNNYNQEHA